MVSKRAFRRNPETILVVDEHFTVLQADSEHDAPEPHANQTKGSNGFSDVQMTRNDMRMEAATH